VTYYTIEIKIKDKIMKRQDIDKTSAEMAEAAISVTDTEFMLNKAEEHIQKLTCELKEKEYAIQHMCQKADFYEQIVKNLTTFK
jgi:hypothetical protein